MKDTYFIVKKEHGEIIGPEHIGIHNGLDLVARVIVGEGWYGLIRNTKLNEVGPFTNQDQTHEALVDIIQVYDKYKCNAHKTLISPEYNTILKKYGVKRPSGK